MAAWKQDSRAGKAVSEAAASLSDGFQQPTPPVQLTQRQQGRAEDSQLFLVVSVLFSSPDENNRSMSHRVLSYISRPTYYRPPSKDT